MKRLLTMLIITAVSGAVLAGADPRPTPKDSRIRHVAYDPNDVVQLLGHYGYTMTIEYHPSEVILDINVGDPMAWQTTPLGNRLVLKPILDDATTNMNILTNYRSYIYELRASKTRDPRGKAITYYLRYQYPAAANRASLARYQQTTKADAEAERRKDANRVDATQLYFGYRFNGDTTLAPVQIFDDGQFTYFRFRDKGAFPAIFAVDGERNESVVNFRIEDTYVVVEQLSSRFTLRRGNQVVSILRDHLPGFENVDHKPADGIDQGKHLTTESGDSGYADW